MTKGGDRLVFSRLEFGDERASGPRPFSRFAVTARHLWRGAGVGVVEGSDLAGGHHGAVPIVDVQDPEVGPHLLLHASTVPDTVNPHIGISGRAKREAVLSRPTAAMVAEARTDRLPGVASFAVSMCAGGPGPPTTAAPSHHRRAPRRWCLSEAPWSPAPRSPPAHKPTKPAPGSMISTALMLLQGGADR
jgi:hypothetical protein